MGYWKRQCRLAAVGGTVGLLLGGLAYGPQGALIGAVAGVILAWAYGKRVLFEAARGALIGTVFLAVVGPGADWLISGVPFRTHLVTAGICGALLGATLGIRNARKRK